MKIIILLILFSFNTYAGEKMFKIQVFRNSDNKQLYGLYAKESDRARRLNDALKFYKEGETILINEDITAELEEAETQKTLEENERKTLKTLIKNIQDPAVKKILKYLVKDIYRG